MNHHRKSAQVWHVFSRDFTVLPAHPHVHPQSHHSRNRNEPYLPLPSQPQLVLICRPHRDGRLSRPWCEVAYAEIRTCNLPIANPAVYHTAASAPVLDDLVYVHQSSLVYFIKISTTYREHFHTFVSITLRFSWITYSCEIATARHPV